MDFWNCPYPCLSSKLPVSFPRASKIFRYVSRVIWSIRNTNINNCTQSLEGELELCKTLSFQSCRVVKFGLSFSINDRMNGTTAGELSWIRPCSSWIRPLCQLFIKNFSAELRRTFVVNPNPNPNPNPKPTLAGTLTQGMPHFCQMLIMCYVNKFDPVTYEQVHSACFGQLVNYSLWAKFHSRRTWVRGKQNFTFDKGWTQVHRELLTSSQESDECSSELSEKMTNAGEIVANMGKFACVCSEREFAG